MTRSLVTASGFYILAGNYFLNILCVMLRAQIALRQSNCGPKVRFVAGLIRKVQGWTLALTSPELTTQFSGSVRDNTMTQMGAPKRRLKNASGRTLRQGCLQSRGVVTKSKIACTTACVDNACNRYLRLTRLGRGS